MKINARKMVTCFGIVLLLPIMIYPLTFSSLVLLISEVLCWGIGVVLLLSKRRLFFKKKSMLLLWMLTVIPITVNSDALRMHQYGFTFLWFTCLLFFLVIEQYKILDFNSAVFFIGVTASIYVVSTILFNMNINNSILLQLAGLFRPSISTGTIKTAGLTSHYSHNGMYIALAGIVWYAYAIIKKEKKYYLLLVLSIVAMLFTQKRGPLIALVLAMLVTTFVREQGSFNRRVQRMIIGAIAVLSGVYITSFLFPTLFSVLERFSWGNNMLSNRQYLWSYAIEMFKKKPLFGHGWGTYANSIHLVISTVDVSSINAHNIYLQLLAEVGIVGTVIFVIAMLRSFVSCFSLNRMHVKCNEVQLTFSLCMQLFFMVYGLTGNTLYDKQMVLPYMIAVAITLFFQDYSLIYVSQ